MCTLQLLGVMVMLVFPSVAERRELLKLPAVEIADFPVFLFMHSEALLSAAYTFMTAFS